MEPPKLLLFDLGSVVVDFIGPQALSALTRGRHSVEDIRARWSKSPALTEFELGRMAPEGFAKAFVAEWDLSLSPTEFLAEFRTWPRAAIEGVPQLLDGLATRWRLACLSNINELHWQRHHDLGLVRHFERCYLSHELGMRKPDREIYAHVLRDLRMAPEEVLFFDDTGVNIDVARALGLRAEHVAGLEPLKAALEKHEII